MTKEELEKKAEEYAEQCYGWTNNDVALDVAKATYITSAEPREKRIAEQEELLNSTLDENKEIYKKMADLDTALEDCTESLTDARIKIKELEKENANLKALRKYELNVSKLEIEKLEKENAELKERVKTLTIHDTNAVLNGLEMKVLKDSHRDRANKTQEQLTKAKKLIEKLLIVSCNSEILIQYPNCKEVLEARVALEQFLMEK